MDKLDNKDDQNVDDTGVGDTNQPGDDTNKDQKEEVTSTQKRINKLVSQNKTKESELSTLKAEIEALKNTVTSKKDDEPSIKEYSDEQDRVEALLDSGETEDNTGVNLRQYLKKINNKIVDIKINEAKEDALANANKGNKEAEQQAKEWGKVVTKYGKYGITDKKSDFFKLADAHFKANPGMSQKEAVSTAFFDLVEDGVLTLTDNKTNNLAGKGGSGSSKRSLGETLDNNEDYIKSRQKKQEAFKKAVYNKQED